MKKTLIISALLLSIISTTSYASVTSATTNTSKVPIQISYNNNKVIHEIQNPNTVISVIGDTDTQYKIKYDNIEGYIQKAYTVEGAQELYQKELEKQALLSGNSTSASSSSSNSDSLASNDASDYESFKSKYINSSNKNSLKTYVEVCKAFYRNYNFSYDYSYTNVPPLLSNRQTDCSTYVSLVLYEYGKANNIASLVNTFSPRKRSTYFNSCGKNLANGKSDPNFTLVKNIKEARFGDILCYSGHVEIYAGQVSNGNAMVYNCGSDGYIKAQNLVLRASRPVTKLTYILRVKY